VIAKSDFWSENFFRCTAGGEFFSPSRVTSRHTLRGEILIRLGVFKWGWCDPMMRYVRLGPVEGWMFKMCSSECRMYVRETESWKSHLRRMCPFLRAIYFPSGRSGFKKLKSFTNPWWFSAEFRLFQPRATDINLRDGHAAAATRGPPSQLFIGKLMNSLPKSVCLCIGIALRTEANAI
jgi:hypothetical protein